MGSARLGSLRRAWGGVAWWLGGVVGANAYEQYLVSHRRRGHDHAPMSEREFWRARTDDQERNPQGRCC